MKITTVGIDLAKNLLQVHGVDERGKACCANSYGAGKLRHFLEICRRV